MPINQQIVEFVKKEIIIFIAAGVLLILTFFQPQQTHNFINYIDTDTILTLAGLMLITVAIKQSNVYTRLTRQILKKIKTERTLALFFVLFSAFLASFMTNDIALFIVVPLTAEILKNIRNDLQKLVVFEALAVNSGSALTPIGNPQNIYLWHKWNISFLHFTAQMLPPFIVTVCVLIIFVIAFFPNRRLAHHEKTKKSQVNKSLFWLSILLLPLFIVAIDADREFWGFAIIFLLYLLLRPSVIVKSDWLLILFFILIFIDLQTISRIEAIDRLVANINLSAGKNVFLFSALISQIISNVPASVFVSHFSNNYQAIAYGVNIGGNGLIIGSLANFIALRLTDNKNSLLKFHLFSIPFFLLTLTIVLMFF